MRDRLRQLLGSLEAELRVQGRWEQHCPPERALQSREPFAVDTLAFDQWLQWIFLPKLHELLARQLPLPMDCAVEPMAEEVYGTDDPDARRLTLIIAEIDALLTDRQAGLN